MAIVDDEDYETLSKFKWYFAADGYARRNRKRSDLNILCSQIYMHKVVSEHSAKQMTDHADGNKLNNVRSNLRPCTRTQNFQNKKRPKNNTSGFKGVSLHKASGLWRASLYLNGRSAYDKCFKYKMDAAKAYDEAAKRLFGEFAKLNFP